MTKGYNKAVFEENIYHIVESSLSNNVKDRPCVFLSHKHEDKPACRKIAGYLKDACIDYYLDENDDALQQAVNAGNVNLITESIKKGIRESSHMLVVVSAITIKSQWVPFEVGYGHAAIIDKAMEINKREDKLKLSILTLLDISEARLPTFMLVENIIRGTKSLNEYIAKITHTTESVLIKETRLFSNSLPNHSLDTVLNWKL